MITSKVFSELFTFVRVAVNSRLESLPLALLSDPASPPPPPPVTRTTAHHEGAMVACAKLGLWREAFRIYDEVEGRVDGEALASA